MTELEKVIEAKRVKKNQLKKLYKKGTIEVGIVESTPVVWKDKLLRFNWKRSPDTNDEGNYTCKKGCFNFVDMETREEVCEFAPGHSFGAAYVENEKMYVIGTKGGFGSKQLNLFVSDDLEHWEEHTIFYDPDWIIYNVSFCKGSDDYVMAIEISHPISIAGEHPYTIVFAHSKDLYNWELYDTDKYVYLKERYAACPAIRYIGGYYYMIYLESFPGYNSAPYITRSKDLFEWELAPVNPVLLYDDNDRKIEHPEDFTKEELERIKTALDTNNSDVDLCEHNGKTIILYSWGNQLGDEFLACAEYDGCMLEFFESFF